MNKRLGCSEMPECLGHTQQFSSHLLSTYYMPGTKRKEMQQTRPEGTPILTYIETTIHIAFCSGSSP